VNHRHLIPFFLFALISAATVGIALTYSTVLKSFEIASSGLIAHVEVGIYTDENCTFRLGSIDWGVVFPGSNKSFTLYIRNEGNVGLVFAVNMTNLAPVEASAFLSLKTDYDGHLVSPSQVLKMTLMLHVAPTAKSTDFSFDIEMSALA